jgi:hypothetical protein
MSTCHGCGAAFASALKVGRPRTHCFACHPAADGKGRCLPRKACAYCDLEFQPTRINNKFCSRKCNYAARDRTAKKREANRLRMRGKRPAIRLCKRCSARTLTPKHWYCGPCVEWVLEQRAKSDRARTRLRDANRIGTTKERGYGAAHQKLRREWKAKVDAGGVKCSRCGHFIFQGEPWDLGHEDRDASRSTYSGPEHRRCNRATASHRKGHSVPRAAWW